MTRTEQGYALWKEDPKSVADARVQARGRIAGRTLKRELVEVWAVPVIEWLSKRIERFESLFRK